MVKMCGKKKGRSREITSTQDKIIQMFIYLFLIAFGVICLFPFVNVFSKSISGESDVMAGLINIIPKNVQWGAYKYVLKQHDFWNALKNSFFVVVVGTILAIFTTSMVAYVLAKKRCREHGFILGLYIFAMIFNAGVIPGYLTVRSLGLYDTMWALILPAIINPYYLMILRSYMASIPDSLEEAARIDGAGHFKIFSSVVIPIAKPSLASVALFFAVDLWNDVFRPMMFLQKTEHYTIQLFIRNLLNSVNDLDATFDPSVFGDVANESIQDAAILLSVVPILMLYPFLQRYFTAGVTVGAVKE